MNENIRNLIAAAAIGSASVYGGMKYEAYTIKQQTGLTNEKGAWVLKVDNDSVPVKKAVTTYQLMKKVKSALDELLEK